MPRQGYGFLWTRGGLKDVKKQVLDLGIRPASHELAALIRNDAPMGKTGNLKKSIQVLETPETMTQFYCMVYSSDYFSFMAEYGTKNNRPYGFFRSGIARSGLRFTPGGGGGASTP